MSSNNNPVILIKANSNVKADATSTCIPAVGLKGQVARYFQNGQLFEMKVTPQHKNAGIAKVLVIANDQKHMKDYVAANKHKGFEQIPLSL